MGFYSPPLAPFKKKLSFGEDTPLLAAGYLIQKFSNSILYPLKIVIYTYLQQ